MYLRKKGTVLVTSGESSLMTVTPSQFAVGSRVLREELEQAFQDVANSSEDLDREFAAVDTARQANSMAVIVPHHRSL